MNGSSCRSPRAALAGLVLALFAGTALAAEDFRILSLVGDRLTIITQGPQVGSHLDQDTYDILPIKVSALDDLALDAADKAVRRARPGATIMQLRATDRSLYEVGDGWQKPDSASIRSLATYVAKAAPVAADSRLLLILPYKTEPQFLTYFGWRGTGAAGGMGFYLGTSNVNRESIPGFLGVFANLQLVLVNLQSGAIEAHQPIIAGTAFSAAMTKGAWNALTAERKIEALQALAQGEIENQVSAMVGSRR
jgi:hypothetical protein